ncbi:MAG: site-specific DNA-methyltransferase [Candidatus Latescibacterota bacterium]|nr:site-specific DNA-methyltransferase [Candidatus Latescibacterota bacterium]
METGINVLKGTASHLAIEDESVDLIVTSPPYPMVEMWDTIFSDQEKQIPKYLSEGQGRKAFELMHEVLDKAWAESYRVLKHGGIACINIGDATRTLNGDFQLYPNQSRILNSCQNLGFVALPDILWRKPTNAPNKFMGSGMLPVGAYVTYEHEYILILRKGDRRAFTGGKEKELRRRSAFFWEERNVWFSDVWFDIKGTGQSLVEKTTRQRSAAFPFELAYRLICMFSINGDVVLDPFVGTGTTLAASLACGRSGIGIEIDHTFIPSICSLLQSMPSVANAYNRERLVRHTQFVAKHTEEKGPLKHANIHYGFPVMTAQEKELIVPELESVRETEQARFIVSYLNTPQCDFLNTSAI